MVETIYSANLGAQYNLKIPVLSVSEIMYKIIVFYNSSDGLPFGTKRNSFPCKTFISKFYISRKKKKKQGMRKLINVYKFILVLPTFMI